MDCGKHSRFQQLDVSHASCGCYYRQNGNRYLVRRRAEDLGLLRRYLRCGWFDAYFYAQDPLLSEVRIYRNGWSVASLKDQRRPGERAVRGFTHLEQPGAGVERSQRRPQGLTGYLRYRGPNNSYGNVAEIELYRDGVKLTGTGFGTPGSWNNQGNSLEKALDGNIRHLF